MRTSPHTCCGPGDQPRAWPPGRGEGQTVGQLCPQWGRQCSAGEAVCPAKGQAGAPNSDQGRSLRLHFLPLTQCREVVRLPQSPHLPWVKRYRAESPELTLRRPKSQLCPSPSLGPTAPAAGKASSGRSLPTPTSREGSQRPVGKAPRPRTQQAIHTAQRGIAV